MAFERFFSFSITLCRFVCDRTSQLANLFSTLSVVEASCAASGFRYALKTHERGPRYLYANPPIQLFGADVLSGNQSLARLSTHVWHFVIVRRTCKRSAFLRRGLLNVWKTKYWLMFLLASELCENAMAHYITINNEIDFSPFSISRLQACLCAPEIIAEHEIPNAKWWNFFKLKRLCVQIAIEWKKKHVCTIRVSARIQTAAAAVAACRSIYLCKFLYPHRLVN